MTIPPTKPDPTLAALEQALGAGGSRRPALKQWMLDHYDAVSALLTGKRPNWKHLTAVFMECGYRNNDGSDLDSENVRLMWLSVRKSQSARKQQQQSPGCMSSAPAPASAAPVADAADMDCDEPPDVLEAVRAKMNKRSGRGS